MKTGLLIFILIFTSCNNSNTKIEKLSPGKVVNQLLKKGEKFQYTVDLSKGECKKELIFMLLFLIREIKL